MEGRELRLASVTVTGWDNKDRTGAGMVEGPGMGCARARGGSCGAKRGGCRLWCVHSMSTSTPRSRLLARFGSQAGG